MANLHNDDDGRLWMRFPSVMLPPSPTKDQTKQIFPFQFPTIGEEEMKAMEALNVAIERFMEPRTTITLKFDTKEHAEVFLRDFREDSTFVIYTKS